MNRRGFLGSIVGAAVAGPSAVKTAAAKAGLGQAAASLGGLVASSRDYIESSDGPGIGPSPAYAASSILKMLRGEDFNSERQREHRAQHAVLPLRSVSDSAKLLMIHKREQSCRIESAVKEAARRHPLFFKTIVSEDQLVAVLEKMVGEGK